MIKKQPCARYWSEDRCLDVTHDVVAELVAKDLAPCFAAFARQDLDDPGHARFRAELYPCLKRVVDHARGLHKKEIRRGSPGYDPARRGRQRRLVKTEPLGAGVVVVDRQPSPEEVASRDDVNAALARLDPVARRVVKAKVLDRDCWGKIADDLGESVDHVKAIYDRAVKALAAALRDHYDVP